MFTDLGICQHVIIQGGNLPGSGIRADKVSATAPAGSAGSTGSPGGSPSTTATIPAYMSSPEYMAMATKGVELFFSAYDDTLRVEIDTLLDFQKALEGLLLKTQQELFKAFASRAEIQSMDWRDSSSPNLLAFTSAALASMIATMNTSTAFATAFPPAACGPPASTVLPLDLQEIVLQPLLSTGYPIQLALRPPAAAVATATAAGFDPNSANDTDPATN